jgi:hypothetical protein
VVQLLGAFKADIIEGVRAMLHGEPPLCSRCKNEAQVCSRSWGIDEKHH